MRKIRRALLSGGLGFAVSLIAGCGGGAGLLSANQASTLNNQLNQVSSALNNGHCLAVQSATRDLVNSIAGLPATLNPKLKQDLDFAANQVSLLAVQECHPVSAPTTTPTHTTSTATTNTQPTTTSTTPTNTQTTTTPTTTTPATTTTTPGSSGGSSGGGALSGGAGGTTGGSGGGTGGALPGTGNGQ